MVFVWDKIRRTGLLGAIIQFTLASRYDVVYTLTLVMRSTLLCALPGVCSLHSFKGVTAEHLTIQRRFLSTVLSGDHDDDQLTRDEESTDEVQPVTGHIYVWLSAKKAEVSTYCGLR